MLIHLRTWNRWQNKTAAQIKSENIIPFDISDMGEDKLSELCRLISGNMRYENFVRIVNAAGYDVKIEKRKCEKNPK